MGNRSKRRDMKNYCGLWLGKKLHEWMPRGVDEGLRELSRDIKAHNSSLK